MASEVGETMMEQIDLNYDRLYKDLVKNRVSMMRNVQREGDVMALVKRMCEEEKYQLEQDVSSEVKKEKKIRKQRDYPKCEECGRNCMKSYIREDECEIYLCNLHHPESSANNIEKRNNRQKNYHNSEKGRDTYEKRKQKQKEDRIAYKKREEELRRKEEELKKKEEEVKKFLEMRNNMGLGRRQMYIPTPPSTPPTTPASTPPNESL